MIITKIGIEISPQVPLAEIVNFCETYNLEAEFNSGQNPRVILMEVEHE